MIRTKFTAALLAATALGGFATAADAATKHKHVTRVVTKTTTDSAAVKAMAEKLEAQQAKIDELTARLNQMAATPPAPAVDADAQAEAEIRQAVLLEQLDAMRSQIDYAEKKALAATPAFGAAPTFKGGAFSFKPNGLIQFDAGYTSNPRNAIATANLGFNQRARRMLFGAAGDLPGDFKYAIQFQFAQSAVDYEDVTLSYEPVGKPWNLTVGYFYPFNTLENLTSNRFVSTVERAAITDAFSEGRRIGVAARYFMGDFKIGAGLFGGVINNANFDNGDWEVAGRALYNPKIGNTQYHLAVNGQYRRFKNTALGLQYRSRPYTQITDQRFIDTGNIAGRSDTIFGVEGAVIHGPWHFQGEAQVVHFDGYRPGVIVDPGQILLGTTLASNPTFWGGYAEVGYWLTGESRGYNAKEGKFDRTRPKNGFDKGGWGALQLVGRVEHVDLQSNVGGTGGNVINGILNGGSQIGYIGALNWWPIDYVRFSLQYNHNDVTGGPRAAAVRPFDPRPAYQRTYGTDGVVVRAQLDF